MGTAERWGAFPDPLLRKGNLGQPHPPRPGCPRSIAHYRHGTAPVNNELPALTAVWRLMAPGGCPKPGQAQLDILQLQPQFPSRAALRDGTHPANRCRQEPGQDNAALVLSGSVGTGTSLGGTTLVLL